MCVSDMMPSSNVNIFRVTAPCEKNPPVIGGFPSQRPVKHALDVFFDLRLNQRLSKQSRSAHYDVIYNGSMPSQYLYQRWLVNWKLSKHNAVMQWNLNERNLHSRKCILKCRLQSGGHHHIASGMSSARALPGRLYGAISCHICHLHWCIRQGMIITITTM